MDGTRGKDLNELRLKIDD